MAKVLQAHIGNHAEWRLTITNADGSAKNLTGLTSPTFLAKKRIDDADGSAVITATPVVADAANGLIDIQLEPSDTAGLTPGVYVWGLQFTDVATKTWEFPEPTEDPGRLILKSGVVAA